MLLTGEEKTNQSVPSSSHFFLYIFKTSVWASHEFPTCKTTPDIFSSQKTETKRQPDEWSVVSAFTTWCRCCPGVCCAAAALRSAVGQRRIFRFRSTLMHLLAAARPPHSVKWCRHGNGSGAQCDRWRVLPWKHHQLNEDLTGCRLILLNFYNISLFNLLSWIINRTHVPQHAWICHRCMQTCSHTHTHTHTHSLPSSLSVIAIWAGNPTDKRFINPGLTDSFTVIISLLISSHTIIIIIIIIIIILAVSSSSSALKASKSLNHFKKISTLKARVRLVRAGFSFFPSCLIAVIHCHHEWNC